jgi:hypothetical protein
MDISGFFNTFLSMMLQGVSNFFNILDSITINGVSLLDFSITILLLSVVLPMVITLVKSRSNRGYKESKNDD